MLSSAGDSVIPALPIWPFSDHPLPGLPATHPCGKFLLILNLTFHKPGRTVAISFNLLAFPFTLFLEGKTKITHGSKSWQLGRERLACSVLLPGRWKTLSFPGAQDSSSSAWPEGGSKNKGETIYSRGWRQLLNSHHHGPEEVDSDPTRIVNGHFALNPKFWLWIPPTKTGAHSVWAQLRGEDLQDKARCKVQCENQKCFQVLFM